MPAIEPRVKDFCLTDVEIVNSRWLRQPAEDLRWLHRRNALLLVSQLFEINRDRLPCLNTSTTGFTRLILNGFSKCRTSPTHLLSFSKILRYSG
jgi:hypothetical protein